MDNLELLTDDELRRRLLQYGFPNLPITQTTRKTLIKKLRNHLSSTTSNLRKTTSLVTRYSSGEESDATDNKNRAAKKQTRMTVSGSASGQKTPPPPKFNSYTQPAVKSPYSRQGNLSSSSGKNVYVSPVIINDSEDDDLDWSMRKASGRSSNNNSFKSSRSVTRTADYSYNTSLDGSQKTTNGSNGYDNENEEDINTTSDYTKRLLQFREGNIQKTQPSNQLQSNLRKRPSYHLSQARTTSEYQGGSSGVNENDIVYHAEPFLETAHVPLSMAIKNFINRLDAAYGFKQTFVPMVLVTFLVIFFVLIIFMYITISPDIEKTLNPSSTLFYPCDQQHEMDATFACIDQQNLVPSLNLLKVLATELQKRAVAQKCGGKDVSNVMCVKDFWAYLNNDNHQSASSSNTVLEVMKDLHNIEYLIDRNKQWGIYNVDNNGKPISLDEVVNQRAHQAECFAILSPKLPLTCTLYNKIQTFFTIIGTLAIIGLLTFLGRKFYYFILHVKEKRKAEINQIMNEIIRLLMEKTLMDKENAFLVVNHLRDKIIEPSRKSELSRAWQEAISYLEQNDSRVHFGFENINGEDFKVIRWIDDMKNLPNNNNNNNNNNINNLSSSHQQSSTSRFSTMRYTAPQPFDARLKKWMCPAFDKSNKISDPPTNCLKIRNMFEKYETSSPNLQAIIQDTILHKVCEKGCKIYDIQLDLKTCCTYVKCATCADAGIVHEEINGWWLINGDDNRLVVVKFLKQDKYHQRFPNSINACSIMYPSSSPIQNYTSTNGHDYCEDDIDDEDDFE